jgi:signal transduction histidine kinase/DNA-binding NarL/FixJ family response regulator
MSIAFDSTSTLSSLPTHPEDDKNWRIQAETQLAELRQALAQAQTQLEVQSNRLLALLGTAPEGPTGQPSAHSLARRQAVLGPVAGLWQQEAHLTQVLDQNPHPIVRLTATGEVRYANPAARALGPALATVGKPNGYLLSLVRAALRLGTTQQQEVMLADNWYSLQVVPGPGDTCATLYLTNSNALHATEQRLAEQHEFYEAILNALAVEVAVFDPQHRFRFVNSKAIKNESLREWVIGKTDAEYCTYRQLPTEIAAERRYHFETARQGSAPVKWEETFTSDQGPQHRMRQLQPLHGPDGTLRLVVATGIDTTARHLAEQKLTEQQAFYEFILNQLPTDIGVFDTQYRYVFVNERGIRDPEVREWVIGKDNFAYFERTGRPREMAEKRQSQLEQALRQRQLMTYEESFPRPDGTRHQLRCLQPVFHPDGSPNLIVCYGLDITERVEAEQTLTQAKLAAEDSSRLKEAFLANMSHEIRTPMNAILGMSQLLAKTPLADDQQAIATSAENLLVIINDVLDLSKLEAGKLVLEIIGFSPTHLLAQVEQTLRFKAAEKGLGLVTILSPQVAPVLLGDPYRIRQVLLNLADNALKFTNKGMVTVECLPAPPQPNAPANTVAVEFRVTDTGIGIEPEYMTTMFTEFSQADSSVTRKFGGTGLGLSICRDLVQLMGSEITVSSQKNKGTTTRFILNLPVGTAQSVTRRKLPPLTLEQRKHLQGKRVLLVEDNAFNRQIAKSFLTQADVHVIEAEHGAQAVEAVQRQRFDLILMDVQMPVMDGYAATALLRQQLALTTPIIALTANAISGEREKCLSAGMNGYLAKPFQEMQLLQLLHDWVLPTAAEDEAAPAELVALDEPAAEPVRPALSANLYSIDDLLKAGQGDPEFVVFMLHTFSESCEEALQDLRRGLAEANLAILKDTAHALKPSLQHLNAWQPLPQVEKLNNWSEDFALEPLAALVDAIEPLLRAVLAQIALDLQEDNVMTRLLAV